MCRKHACSACCLDAQPTLRKWLGIFIHILLGPSGLDTRGARAQCLTGCVPGPLALLQTRLYLKATAFGVELERCEEEVWPPRKHLLSVLVAQDSLCRLAAWICEVRLLGAPAPQRVSCNQRIRFAIRIHFSSLPGVLSKPPFEELTPHSVLFLANLCLPSIFMADHFVRELSTKQALLPLCAPSTTEA